MEESDTSSVSMDRLIASTDKGICLALPTHKHALHAVHYPAIVMECNESSYWSEFTIEL